MLKVSEIRKHLRQIEGATGGEHLHGWQYTVVRVLLTIYRFIQITIREFLDDRLILRAMALTFATILSLIPLLAILFSMFKMFGGGEWFMSMLEPVLLRNLAPGSGTIAAQRIEEILRSGSGPTVGGIGLLFLVLAVYGIFSGIESTFNLIWGVPSRAGALHRVPLYWGLVTIIPILVVSSLAITTYLKALPLVHQAVEGVNLPTAMFQRVIPILMTTLGFFLLYKFLPATRVRTRSAIAGALFAGLFYEILKGIFFIYTGKLVKYDVVYGSLAIIPLLMVWVNLSWIMILLGVEICFVVQHYKTLIHKRKHIVISRKQKDALAYLMMLEVTRAFRGLREPVTLEEWTNNYQIPPGVVREAANRLMDGGIINQTHPDGNLIQTRSPRNIKISDIECILSGEAFVEWDWPDVNGWREIREMISDGVFSKRSGSGIDNLDTLMRKMIEGAGKTINNG